MTNGAHIQPEIEDEARATADLFAKRQWIELARELLLREESEEPWWRRAELWHRRREDQRRALRRMERDGNGVHENGHELKDPDAPVTRSELAKLLRSMAQSPKRGMKYPRNTQCEHCKRLFPAQGFALHRVSCRGPIETTP